MPLTLNGLVIKQQSGFFTVQTERGAYVCQLRGRIKEEAARKRRKEAVDPTLNLCAIGDRVTITALEDRTGVIEVIHPRERVLSRSDIEERGAGRQEREQIIIANPDQAVFVLAVANPMPKPRGLDRLLVMAEKAQIPSIQIVCNKIDLIPRQEADALFGLYQRLGYPVLYTSARTGEGVDELRALLTGRISALTGPSGVGKTSLLNAVQPGLGRAVRAVSRATSKGRHTTVYRELIPLSGGGYVADTPGIRTISIWDVEPGELDAYFVDIRPFVRDCAFADCTHAHEPGCAVIAAVERGEIDPGRYESYLRLREEIENSYEDWV